MIRPASFRLSLSLEKPRSTCFLDGVSLVLVAGSEKVDCEGVMGGEMWRDVLVLVQECPRTESWSRIEPEAFDPRRRLVAVNGFAEWDRSLLLEKS